MASIIGKNKIKIIQSVKDKCLVIDKNDRYSLFFLNGDKICDFKGEYKSVKILEPYSEYVVLNKKNGCSDIYSIYDDKIILQDVIVQTICKGLYRVFNDKDSYKILDSNLKPILDDTQDVSYVEPFSNVEDYRLVTGDDTLNPYYNYYSLSVKKKDGKIDIVDYQGNTIISSAKFVDKCEAFLMAYYDDRHELLDVTGKLLKTFSSLDFFYLSSPCGSRFIDVRCARRGHPLESTHNKSLENFYISSNFTDNSYFKNIDGYVISLKGQTIATNIRNKRTHYYSLAGGRLIYINDELYNEDGENILDFRYDNEIEDLKYISFVYNGKDFELHNELNEKVLDNSFSDFRRLSRVFNYNDRKEYFILKSQDGEIMIDGEGKVILPLGKYNFNDTYGDIIVAKEEVKSGDEIKTITHLIDFKSGENFFSGEIDRVNNSKLFDKYVLVTFSDCPYSRVIMDKSGNILFKETSKLNASNLKDGLNDLEMGFDKFDNMIFRDLDESGSLKYGVVSSSGEILLPAIYDNISLVYDHYLVSSKGDAKEHKNGVTKAYNVSNFNEEFSFEGCVESVEYLRGKDNYLIKFDDGHTVYLTKNCTLDYKDCIMYIDANGEISLHCSDGKVLDLPHGIISDINKIETYYYDDEGVFTIEADEFSDLPCITKVSLDELASGEKYKKDSTYMLGNKILIIDEKNEGKMIETENSSGIFFKRLANDELITFLYSSDVSLFAFDLNLNVYSRGKVYSDNNLLIYNDNFIAIKNNDDIKNSYTLYDKNMNVIYRDISGVRKLSSSSDEYTEIFRINRSVGFGIVFQEQIVNAYENTYSPRYLRGSFNAPAGVIQFDDEDETDAFYDERGNIIIPHGKYSDIESLNYTVYLKCEKIKSEDDFEYDVDDEDRTSYDIVDRFGNIFLSDVEETDSNTNGILVYFLDGSKALYNSDMKPIISRGKYEVNTTRQLIRVKNGLGRFELFNINGDRLLDGDYISIEEFDYFRNTINKFDYTSYKVINEIKRLLAVSNDGKNFGLIDADDGKEILPLAYRDIEYIDDSHVFFLADDDSYGIIDIETKEEIIPRGIENSLSIIDDLDMYRIVFKNEKAARFHIFDPKTKRVFSFDDIDVIKSYKNQVDMLKKRAKEELGDLCNFDSDYEHMEREILIKLSHDLMQLEADINSLSKQLDEVLNSFNKKINNENF